MGRLILGHFASDEAVGILAHTPWDRRRSSTKRQSFRAYDLLYVAAERLAGLSDFLTFDKQTRFAPPQGWTVFSPLLRLMICSLSSKMCGCGRLPNPEGWWNTSRFSVALG
jgi:hypothetical protein